MHRPGRRVSLPVVLLVTSIGVAACIGAGTAERRGSAATPAGSPPGIPAIVATAPSPATPDPADAVAPLNGTEIDLADPTSLAVQGSTIWAVAQRDVARVDPAAGTAAILGIGTGGQFAAIAATTDAVWVADFDGKRVLRIDPSTGGVVARIAVGAAIEPLAVGDSVWVTNHHEGSVARIDPATNEVSEWIPIGDPGEAGPSTLANGHGSVWVTVPRTPEVVRVDPGTAQVIARIPMPDGFGTCGELLASEDAVWVTGCSESPDIVRIDPATNTVGARIELGGNAAQPILVDGAIWLPVIGTGPTGELVRIDPETNAINRRIPVAGLTGLGGAVVVADTLWIANGRTGLIGIPLAALTAP